VVFRLLLRFLSATFNLQVKVIGFCDLWLPLNLLKDGLPNVCDSWLSVFLLKDGLPNFCDCWLPVAAMVEP
jgi:hypothetical protein